MKLNIRFRNSIKQSPHLKMIAGCSGFLLLIFIISFLYMNIGNSRKAAATANETLSSGSFIVNMGITPQTIANGLKPYGMVYDLIVNYDVPVKWVISTSKVKDGGDFIYKGTNYKGGTFIIPAEYIDTAVTSLISSWQLQGVQGIYATSSLTVPVYATLNAFPGLMADTSYGYQAVFIQYMDNAGIPSSAYTFGIPSVAGPCKDVWVTPHGGAAWSTHSNLLTYVNSGGYVYAQCHGVSMMENLKNPNPPNQQMNFLTINGLQCYGAGKCGSTPESHSSTFTFPVTYSNPSDPIMQFIGSIAGSCNNGAERWFIPLSTGGWRAGTVRLAVTSNGVSPREGVLLAYGYAYGNSSAGMVCYEGGHDLNASGTTAEKVASQRVFLNFCLQAGINKALIISPYSVPASYSSGQGQNVSVTISSGVPPYSYQWSSTIGGNFSSANTDSATYTAPVVTSSTSGVVKCIVTDVCGRKTFISQPITVDPDPGTLPVELLSFSANSVSNNKVELNWQTAVEKNNDYFSIERSKDARAFEKILRVRGAGSTTQPKSYSEYDISPVSGIAYYRLKQTDFNGTITLLKTVSLNRNIIQNSFANVYVEPNPSDNHFSIYFNSEEEASVLIEMRNIEGKIVYRENILSNAGINSFSVNNAKYLNSGIYFLTLSTAKKHSDTYKIVIK